MKRRKKTSKVTPKLTPQNILKYIFGISIFLSLFINLLLPRLRPAPVQIAEVSTPACSRFVGTAITPDAVSPGDSIQVSCDFGLAPIDCVKPLSAPQDFESCTFDSYDGTIAKFDCVAPDKKGYYLQFCSQFLTDQCAALDMESSCTSGGTPFAVVDASVTPPSKPTVTTSCVSGQPKVAITWTGTPGDDGFWVDLSEKSNHMSFYGKNVPTGLTTDATGFLGSAADNFGLPLSLEPDKTYYAWAYNGNVSETSTGFKLPDCTQIASPTPSPSPSPAASLAPTPTITLRHDGSTCSSLTFTWDKLNNVPGYVLDLADNADFRDARSSGVLQSSFDRYEFKNLDVDRGYYVRISAANIHDFPRYTKLANIKTSSSCVTATPTPSATPKPSVKPAASVKPKASPTPSLKPKSSATASSQPESSLAPSEYSDKRFDNVTPDLPAAGESVKPRSPLARFLLWFFALFGK